MRADNATRLEGSAGDPIDAFGLTPEALGRRLGGSGRAALPWRSLRRGLDPRGDAALDEGLRRRLAACDLEPLRLINRQVAADGTRKLLLAGHDGRAVETVVIPGRGRSTVCVSSQVGCGRGCGFCVTASMGLVRSLRAAEITAQVWAALGEVRLGGMPKLSNVVFMGMGEPLDNLEEVAASIAVLIHPKAFGIGPSRITLSSVGTSPRAISELRHLPVGLAWSLHSASDEVRRRLIPTSKHPVAALRDAFLEVVRARGADLFVEITLLRDVNDRAGDAEATAGFLAPFAGRARVNLLPMNLGREEFAPAAAASAETYRRILYERGYRCLVRRARGDDIAAACGQLAQLHK